MENTFGINIIPENDDARIAVLKRYKILDTPPEHAFDNVAKLATQIFNVPISLVSLVDTEQVFFKANVGMGNARSTSRGLSLCSLAVLKDEVTVFEDAVHEPCLLANPLVSGAFGLKFYAGAPLITHDGFLIGTMCIVDKVARNFSEADRNILAGLAKIVMDEIELRLQAIDEREKQISINEELAAANEEQTATNEELAATIEELATTNEELTSSNQELEEIRINLSEVLNRLVESDAKARYIISDAPVAISVLAGRELIIESANNKILQIWGKDNSIIGMRLEAALPELEGQPFLGILDQVYITGIPYYGTELKALLHHRDKLEEIYLNFVYHPVKDMTGVTNSILVVATDVTEQVMARHKVERAEEMLRMATAAADVGTWHMDIESRNFTPSPKLKEIFGFNPTDEMSFQAALEQIADGYKDKVTFAVEESITKGKEYHVEYPILDFNDKELRWVKATGKTYISDHETPSFFSGVAVDITEQKQDEQRKNDFIAMVSHELKTPLTSLKAYVQMLLAKAKKSEDIFTSGALEKVLVQANKMGKLIQGFLDVARLEGGKIHLNPETFKIDKLIKEVIAENNIISSSHKLTFECEDLTVHADKDKIEQVLNNLVSNAIKYSPKGKNIEISCKKSGENVQISVKDEGIGIKQQDINKLFERFYRIENQQTERISGFGIGLYLCFEIIQRHHGHIWVESQPGQGSTFHFTLPLSDNQ